MGLVWYDSIIIGVEVHGAVGNKCYRYQHRKQQMMTRYGPTNRQTAEQQTWRAIFTGFAAQWAAMSVEEKAEWTAKSKAARKRPRWASGYVYFLSKMLKPYYKRSVFQIGSSQVGTDYILYGRYLTVGTSLVGSGDKIP